MLGIIISYHSPLTGNLSWPGSVKGWQRVLTPCSLGRCCAHLPSKQQWWFGFFAPENRWKLCQTRGPGPKVRKKQWWNGGWAWQRNECGLLIGVFPKLEHLGHRGTNSWSVAADATFNCCWQVDRKVSPQMIRMFHKYPLQPSKRCTKAQSALKVTLFFIVPDYYLWLCLKIRWQKPHPIYRWIRLLSV